MIQELFGWCRYDESKKNYKKYLELKPGNSAGETELSQLLQAQSALETALKLFDTGDHTKSLEFLDKVVLVFSPACSEVISSFIQLDFLPVLIFSWISTYRAL